MAGLEKKIKCDSLQDFKGPNQMTQNLSRVHPKHGCSVNLYLEIAQEPALCSWLKPARTEYIVFFFDLSNHFEKQKQLVFPRQYYFYDRYSLIMPLREVKEIVR